MGKNRKLRARRKREREVIEDPIFSARRTYEISEHFLVDEVTRAFQAYGEARSQGQYCEGGMDWMLQYLEEAFRLMGLDEIGVLVKKDMNECFWAWKAYLDRKAEEEERLSCS